MRGLLSKWPNCLKHYGQMSLFTSSPSNLPYSPECIYLTLLVYIGVGELLLGDERSLSSILVQVAVEIFLLFLISLIILKFINKPQRLFQTMSALIGVNLIVSIVSLPVAYLLPEVSSGDRVDPIVLQVNLLLLLWNLAIISLIFKRAFEIRTIIAGFIAFNYFLLYELILINFFNP